MDTTPVNIARLESGRLRPSMRTLEWCRPQVWGHDPDRVSAATSGDVAGAIGSCPPAGARAPFRLASPSASASEPVGVGPGHQHFHIFWLSLMAEPTPAQDSSVDRDARDDTESVSVSGAWGHR